MRSARSVDRWICGDAQNAWCLMLTAARFWGAPHLHLTGFVISSSHYFHFLIRLISVLIYFADCCLCHWTPQCSKCHIGPPWDGGGSHYMCDDRAHHDHLNLLLLAYVPNILLTCFSLLYSPSSSSLSICRDANWHCKWKSRHYVWNNYLPSLYLSMKPWFVKVIIWILLSHVWARLSGSCSGPPVLSLVFGAGCVAAPTLQSAAGIPAGRGKDAQHNQWMAVKGKVSGVIWRKDTKGLLYLNFFMESCHLWKVRLLCRSTGFLELFALKLVVTSF